MSKKIDFVPEAVSHITNTLSLQIKIIVNSGMDIIIMSRFVDSGIDEERPTRSVLHYDSKNNPYFMRHRQRYYLCDFVRV